MTKKNIIVLLSMLLLSGLTFAQVKDTTEPYSYKNLTPEEALELFGPIKGVKFNKITGDSREIKDITIKGNKIQTILYNYGSVCAPLVLKNVLDLV